MRFRPAIAVLAFEMGVAAFPGALSGVKGRAAAQNPLSALENEAKEKAAEEALTKVLNDNLPLTLDAKDVYPTVTTLPGPPFSPTPLKLTADQLNQPLAPGDYTISTLAFCSEYSVHQPGAGTAYVLGPYEGKAAGAIGALIWRGTVQYQIAPQSLQAVSWAIQSGLTYDQMPKSYQQIVDQVIPDLKSEITGDAVTNLENTYNSLAKTASLPPLDTMLAKLGEPGQLALDAERQRQILTAQNTSDQLKQQTLFQGQESGIYTPVKAEDGPWTERVPGQVYMKLLIAGGNMAANNVMQIRVMPVPATTARNAEGNTPNGPRLLRSAYGEPQLPPAAGQPPTVTNLMEGMLGYSQGRGAQALGQVPVVGPPPPVQGPPAPPPPTVAGTVKNIEGNANVKRAGTDTWEALKVGDPLYIGDILQTTEHSETDVVMADGTEWNLAENTEWDVENYKYEPESLIDDIARYQVLQGTFLYVSGLIGKNGNTPPNVMISGCQIIGGDVQMCGGVGIRGTEFIMKVDPNAKTMEIDLIKGAVAITPAGSTSAGPNINAPMQIEVSPQGVKTLPLTQDQYKQIEAQNFPAVPTS
jgi:hypothetical protein